jgi:hypothetical protein
VGHILNQTVDTSVKNVPHVGTLLICAARPVLPWRVSRFLAGVSSLDLASAVHSPQNPNGRGFFISDRSGVPFNPMLCVGL